MAQAYAGQLAQGVIDGGISSPRRPIPREEEVMRHRAVATIAFSLVVLVCTASPALGPTSYR